MTERKGTVNYEESRRSGYHMARILNPLWERIEKARERNLDLALLDGITPTIEQLLEEALNARERKRRKRAAA